jgi:hypothetical protein
VLEEAGWKIIRFGGSEVHRDSWQCAAEALRHAGPAEYEAWRAKVRS